MAVTFVQVGGIQNSATLPTISPASHADTLVGDILVCQLINKSVTANATSPPDGTWTPIITEEVNDCTTAADDHQYSAYWKRADANGAVSFTFTKTTDDNVLFAGVISSWRGALSSGSPLDATAPARTETAGAADNVTFPAFDPTATDVHVIYLAYYGNDQTTFAAAMSADTNPDCTLRYDIETATGNDATLACISGDSNGASIASLTWASASTTDAGSTGVVFGLVAEPPLDTKAGIFDQQTPVTRHRAAKVAKAAAIAAMSAFAYGVEPTADPVEETLTSTMANASEETVVRRSNAIFDTTAGPVNFVQQTLVDVPQDLVRRRKIGRGFDGAIAFVPQPPTEAVDTTTLPFASDSFVIRHSRAFNEDIVGPPPLLDEAAPDTTTAPFNDTTPHRRKAKRKLSEGFAYGVERQAPAADPTTAPFNDTTPFKTLSKKRKPQQPISIVVAIPLHDYGYQVLDETRRKKRKRVVLDDVSRSTFFEDAGPAVATYLPFNDTSLPRRAAKRKTVSDVAFHFRLGDAAFTPTEVVQPQDLNSRTKRGRKSVDDVARSVTFSDIGPVAPTDVASTQHTDLNRRTKHGRASEDTAFPFAAPEAPADTTTAPFNDATPHQRTAKRKLSEGFAYGVEPQAPAADTTTAPLNDPTFAKRSTRSKTVADVAFHFRLGDAAFTPTDVIQPAEMLPQRSIRRNALDDIQYIDNPDAKTPTLFGFEAQHQNSRTKRYDRKSLPPADWRIDGYTLVSFDLPTNIFWGDEGKVKTPPPREWRSNNEPTAWPPFFEDAGPAPVETTESGVLPRRRGGHIVRYKRKHETADERRLRVFAEMVDKIEDVPAAKAATSQAIATVAKKAKTVDEWAELGHALDRLRKARASSDALEARVEAIEIAHRIEAELAARVAADEDDAILMMLA
jgi:hypothetical protein